MRIGSLFSGIGGLELGLERAGVGHTVFHVEQDPYCRAVLAKHWPGVPQFDDVRTVGAHTLPPVDVLCGGFPCQDISLAGKGAGIDGARSGLWAEYARLIDELRPRWVVAENVSALRSRGLDRVLGELAALGYDAEWHCIPAAYVGAPHRRDRIWIVAYPQRQQLRLESGRSGGAGGAGASLAGGDGEAQSLADAAGDGRREERPNARGGAGGSGAQGDLWCGSLFGGAGVADAEHGGREGRHAERAGPEATLSRSWWAVEPDVGRVAHGVPRRVDRLRALGNAVVPQVAEVIGRLIVAREQSLTYQAAA